MKKIDPKTRHNQCQWGLTLVELLIALTLGLVVTATILQIYLSSKQAYRLQEQSSRMQEDGSYALELLSKYMRMAGYRSELSAQRNFAFLRTQRINGMCGRANENFADGQVIAGIKGENDDTGDCIIIRYRGSDDGAMADCFGSNRGNNNQIINERQTIINAFYLSTDQDNNSALFCRSMVLNANGTQNEFTPGQAFVPGVQNMKILYGVNNSGNPRTGAQAYLTADRVTNWNAVISVKIALLFSSDKNIIDRPQPYIFPPWSNNSTTPENNDFKLRRVLNTTINLRNQSQTLY